MAPPMKKSTFHFTEEEKRIFDDANVSKDLLKETCLHWWFEKIIKKEHKDLLGFNDVMKELQFSPPTNAMKRGGILYQKGAESFSHLKLK